MTGVYIQTYVCFLILYIALWVVSCKCDKLQKSIDRLEKKKNV